MWRYSKVCDLWLFKVPEFLVFYPCLLCVLLLGICASPAACVQFCVVDRTRFVFVLPRSLLLPARENCADRQKNMF